MHARVAVYQLKKGSAAVVAELARKGMLPFFRRQSGFRGYSVVTTENDGAVSISLWDSEDDALSAVSAAAQWVEENVAEHVVSVRNHVGSIAFEERHNR